MRINLVLSFALVFFIGQVALPPIPTALADSQQSKTRRAPIEDGIWFRQRSPKSTSGQQTTIPKLDKLRTLPYLQGTKPPQKESGVVIHDLSRAHPGVNLFTSAHKAEAYLMDMNGKILHTWRYARDSLYPQQSEQKRWGKYWRRARVFPNGDIIAIYDYLAIIRINQHSRLIWSYAQAAHHDFDWDDKGRLWVLGQARNRKAKYPGLAGKQQVFEDFIAILDPMGKEIDRFWIPECLERSKYAELFLPSERDKFNTRFHVNSLRVLDGHYADKSPIFAKGNLLVSLKVIDTVGIIDPKTRRFVWAMRGPWKQQHEPVLLAANRMLVFDNYSLRRASRVLEFNPLNGKIFWSYRGSRKRPFFSSICGAAQRLANGNTLITESDYGTVFEVTRKKKIVWKYISPHRAGANKEFVAIIPIMERLDPKDLPFLNIPVSRK